MAPGSKTKDSQLRLLLVESDENDAANMLARFREADHAPQALRVSNAEALRGALQAQAWDAILCRHRLPGLTALAALKLMQELEFGMETGIMRQVLMMVPT